MSRRGAARIGCSGWSYDDWRGVVYPADAKPSRWFGLYADLGARRHLRDAGPPRGALCIHDRLA